jgi:hypothetical protein
MTLVMEAMSHKVESGVGTAEDGLQVKWPYPRAYNTESFLPMTTTAPGYTPCLIPWRTIASTSVTDWARTGPPSASVARNTQQRRRRQ